MSAKPQIKDGDRFGNLCVISEQFRCDGRTYVLCRCACGNVRRVGCDHLKDGHTTGCRSCCNRRHGHAGDRDRSQTYSTWAGIKRRCTNPNTPFYKDYGGRGIAICERWGESYEVFLRDVGERPSIAHTLDRIDNNGNYEPGNCRWATRNEQARNTSRNVNITINGKTQCAKDWCHVTGVNYTTALYRIRRGEHPVEAVTRPVATRTRRQS